VVLVDLSRNVKFELDKVVDHDEAADDETLTYFDAVDASVDVDGVGAENGEGAHVNVVQNS